MRNLLRNASLSLLALSLAACQSAAPRADAAPSTATPTSATSGDMRSLLGEYDNHAQYLDTAAGIAPPALHQWLRPTSETKSLLWQLRAADGSSEGRWLLREENGVLVPYRPLGATASAAFDAKTDDYRFKSEDWAPLRACAMARERGTYAYRADAGGCSALLPGLGASAALLPQSFSLSGDTLTLTTVSDAARGASANTVSHRVRWFGGWDAINGAGPKAGAESKDWHLRRDLRLHSEGDRVPLRWRDGAESGYSVELARLIYRESNTEVLRLAVIDDASGKVLSYAWANPDATRIGLNLGWVQIGLEQGVAPDPGKPTPEPRNPKPAKK